MGVDIIKYIVISEIALEEFPEKEYLKQLIIESKLLDNKYTNDSIKIKYNIKKQITAMKFILSRDCKVLPKSISEFIYLKELHIHASEVTNFYPWIDKLVNLNILNLQIGAIHEITELILKLKLKLIVMNIKKIGKYPVEFVNWVRKAGDFAFNPLNEFPTNVTTEDIRSLSNDCLVKCQLKTEDIHEGTYVLFNSEKKIISTLIDKYDFINKNQNYYSYVFEYNGIGLKKTKYNNVMTISRLGFSKMGVDIIPEEIFALKNLTILNFNYNKLSQIPDSIAKLKKLRELNLYNNNISKINPIICKCKKLTILHLGKNKISELPKSLENCNKLKELYLRDNLLTEYKLDMPNLRVLALDNNNLAKISFNNLKLTHLYLDGNDIKSALPAIIKKNDKLIRVDVDTSFKEANSEILAELAKKNVEVY